MNQRTRRLAPRQVFVLAGLLVVGLTAYGDRHLIGVSPLMKALDGLVLLPGSLGGELTVDETFKTSDPKVGGVETLRAAAKRLEDANLEFSEGFQEEYERFPVEERKASDVYLGEEAFSDPDFLTEHELWPVYWRVRELRWPAYASAVERFMNDAQEAQALDPTNGVFEVMSGLIELDLCMEPSPADPLFDHSFERKDEIARLRITDPKRLARAVKRIENGLAREEFTFRDTEVMRVRAAPWADEASLHGMGGELLQASTMQMPELMPLKQRVIALSYAAARLRRDGAGTGEAELGVARRIALRHGAEAGSLISLLVAIAELGTVDHLWMEEAAHRGDVARVVAAQDEMRRITDERNRARRNHDGDVSRMGFLDAMLTPVGGWGTSRADLAANRLFDYALVESLVIWSLILLTALALPCLWWNARVQARPGAVSGGGFTLGDLLSVVLPSVVGLALLYVVFSRLHPSRELGIVAGRGQMLFVVGLQWIAVILGAGLAFSGLLRASVLAKHGLSLRNPALCRWGVGLVSTAAFLVFFWIGPYSLTLAPVAGVLALVGIVLGGKGGLWGRAHADEEIRKSLQRFESRVGLACLGASLCLLGVVETVLVTPRREALTERYRELSLQRFLGEGEHWGRGEPRKLLNDLLTEAPDGPTQPGE